MGYIADMEKEQLKTIRSKMKLSQSKLAKELGLSTNTISRYEQGVLSIPKYVELAVLYLYGLSKKKGGKK
jgi:transcriptional regulator with XRE-family HTH domain